MALKISWLVLKDTVLHETGIILGTVPAQGLTVLRPDITAYKFSIKVMAGKTKQGQEESLLEEGVS